MRATARELGLLVDAAGVCVAVLSPTGAADPSRDASLPHAATIKGVKNATTLKQSALPFTFHLQSLRRGRRRNCILLMEKTSTVAIDQNVSATNIGFTNRC
jgi:hypothetical protein